MKLHIFMVAFCLLSIQLDFEVGALRTAVAGRAKRSVFDLIPLENIEDVKQIPGIRRRGRRRRTRNRLRFLVNKWIKRTTGKFNFIDFV